MQPSSGHSLSWSVTHSVTLSAALSGLCRQLQIQIVRHDLGFMFGVTVLLQTITWGQSHASVMVLRDG